ncbi:MAG: hypothetical protein V1854_00995 [Methanobacteriota archaeon]
MFEKLKKLWQECKDRVDAEHTIEMTESTPVDLSGDASTPIDTEIAALVAEMNRVGIHTTCSCQGHDGGKAYVSIRLGESTTYEYRKDIFGPGQDELVLIWKRKSKPAPACASDISTGFG